MAKKYALLTEDGMIRGFLSDDINEISPDAVPISDKQWVDWQANPTTRRWVGGKLKTIEAPAVEQPPAARIITPRAFRQHFSLAERSALTLAASRALDAGDATLQVFLDDLSASQEVDLDHPELRAGMDAIVAAGLMTEARAAEILAA